MQNNIHKAEEKKEEEGPKEHDGENDFKQDIERMKEMQTRSELMPDEVEDVKEEEPVLADDARLAIGFKSFNLIQVLGQGGFGKVFLVDLKDNKSKQFAMKVLSKQELYKNKHLKYALTECNVLKKMDNPYVIKMHYSF